MTTLQKAYLKIKNQVGLKLTEVLIPTVGDDDILIKHSYIGLNFIDIEYSQGHINIPGDSFIPGIEGVGSIVQMGRKVKDFKIGDRVAYGTARLGGYAEYNLVKKDYVIGVPKNISDQAVAAFLTKGMMAHLLLRRTFFIRPDNNVLIHAGAGGVGHLLIRLAKHFQAKVIATVGTEFKEEFARKEGADHLINYGNMPKFSENILDLTEGNGVNVVYDAVGSMTFDESLKSLAPFGLMVSYGRSCGSLPKFDLNKLSTKSLFLTVPKLIHYKQNRLELILTAMEVFNLIDKKIFPNEPNKIYTFDQIPQAHADMLARNNIGSSIVKL